MSPHGTTGPQRVKNTQQTITQPWLFEDGDFSPWRLLSENEQHQNFLLPVYNEI